MTGKQSAVLWLGILLIAAQFFFGGQLHFLFGQIKSTGPASSPSRTMGGLSSGSPGNNNPVLGPKGSRPL